MTSDDPSRAATGILVTTETERVELGTHHGRRLRGRVQRRVLRAAGGGRFALRIELGRARAVAVEVDDGARRYDVPITTHRDP